MTIQASAYTVVNPSFIEPDILLQYTQPSQFTDLLADGELRTRLAEDDLLVYMKTLKLRTKIAAGTAGSNELPGVDIQADMISTPTYLFQTRSQYNHRDIAAAGRWGFSAVDAYKLGMRQANFQLARTASLFGMNPQNGEGFLNAPSAFSLNLPPDSNGNDTVSTYDNGEMAFFILQEIYQLKVRLLQVGQSNDVTVLAPQREIAQWQSSVVQLTQYQRIGAGTHVTSGTVTEVAMANGDKITFAVDDTLIGAGAGGADAIIIAMPKLKKPQGGRVNTNEFARLTPGNEVCLTQYCDMAAPREITSPLAQGATDMITEWRVSSGWAPRSTAVTIVSMNF